jgi:hypothetical protein
MAIKRLLELDDYQLSHNDQDCRGWHCVNAMGIQIGTVSEMLVDEESERVIAVVLDTGVEIPASEITLLDGLVVVAESHLPAASSAMPPPRSTG